MNSPTLTFTAPIILSNGHLSHFRKAPPSNPRTRSQNRPRTNPSACNPPQNPRRNPASTRGTESLHTGKWFKLICGASTHDTPTIQNLCEVYTKAGADCIDVAADFAVLHAARQGIARGMTEGGHVPLLMASVSDAEDVHFRKAVFNPTICPSNCPRPCERSCPADAISTQGVHAARCYGCGRCIPVCPLGLISTQEYTHDTAHVREIMRTTDGLEIHTAEGHMEAFRKLWGAIADMVPRLRVIAVSLPGFGDEGRLTDALNDMWQVMRGTLENGDVELIWQTDGRPMSGDIGAGTARAAVRLAGSVRGALTRSGIPGHVQLAGGTNWKTVPLMREAGLLRVHGADERSSAAGVAMGGYARKIVREELGEEGGFGECMTPESFERALNVALPLVQAIKER